MAAAARLAVTPAVRITDPGTPEAAGRTRQSHARYAKLGTPHCSIAHTSSLPRDDCNGTDTDLLLAWIKSKIIGGERDMVQQTAHRPGEQASVTGMYVLLNPEGTATTVRVAAFQGTACPVAPHGWMWMLDPRAGLPAD